MTDEERVRSLMGEISIAFIGRDGAALREIFDDSFTLLDPDGKVLSKDQWIADVENGDLTVQSVDSEAFDIQRVDENAFRVRGQLRMSARYSKGDWNGSFKYLGLYQKHDSGWKLVLSSAQRVTP
jgi:hypothetical protein